ncbi:GNAT family N-acetyltransferase [Vibrio sp. Of7-15]|uniref:GNAT family N-acetyltransferase n=1 Tax=Vibrio sp. Of7-15 TaxID=2724879 RepID=UPI001EF3A6A4|nr:GNAT family N-acetyltransferase [Vibrio sp. Of7-15]MCG7499670.1 GNAT family N-acetyltransferase [Vibrio sp. Of7-15]
MDFVIKENPEEKEIEEVRAGLIEHNSPFLSGVEEQEVACFLYHDDGAKIGGITGRIWGSWLLIKFLWVDANHKNSGLGSILLSKFEQYAVEKGCTSALVDTFSFQARPFYEKQGYQCQMTLNDYPVKDQLHFLTKQL